jgi:hypothetical protein
MDIQRTGTLDSTSKVHRNTSRTDTTAPAVDEQDFSQADSLRGALDQLAGARPEKVQLARELASSVDYPPAKTIRQISTLLAVKIQGPMAW